MKLADKLIAIADRLEAAQRHTDAGPIEDVGTVWADTDEVIAAQLELRALAGACDDDVAVACVAAPLFASLMAKHGEVELDDAVATQHRLARTALSQAQILLDEATNAVAAQQRLVYTAIVEDARRTDEGEVAP